MGAGALRRSLAVAARLSAVAGAVGCIAAAAASHGADGKGVRAVRFGGDARTTRVVVELDRPAKGRVLDGSETPSLLQIKLAGAASPGALSGRGSGLVESWRTEPQAGGSRLKLALKGPARVQRRFLLPPGEGYSSYRYVVDLEATGPAAVAPAQDAPRRLTGRDEPLQVKKVIVVDAGHGGRDPGAQGASLLEKEVTLAAALELKRRLEAGGRYEVVLTRAGDELIPLDSRVRIARQAGADLFVSLHADSGSEPGLRGASVYTLSPEGAERAAGRLTEGPAGLTKAGMGAGDRTVERILLDLTQRATTSRSSAFAEGLLQRLSERTPLLRGSHRSAGFVVLLAPDVPAVLLEMGFLSNAEDEALLADSRGRRRLVEAMAAAIERYFDEAGGAV